MKIWMSLGGVVCAMVIAAEGQSNLMIIASHGNGILEWTYPTNVGATSYRVEWASQAGGPWATFSNAAARLDNIEPTGTTMSAAVPMFYRVAARPPSHSPVGLVLQDDYEGSSVGENITDVFRSPTIGAYNSTAWYEGHGASEATVISHLEGKCAQVHVPTNTALDYISHLGVSCSGLPFLLTWDIEIESRNGGGGMFFVRFPHAVDGMQILFGFLDDGRVIRFFDVPAANTFVTVGTWQAQTRYRVYLIYDLAAATYSVLFDGAWIVHHAAIPGYLATNSISEIGFDVNQTMGLPGQPAQGNTYYVDNVRFGPLYGSH